MPDDPSCDTWDWDDDDGVWECDDYDSPHYGAYYLGGSYFASKSALKKSSSYKSYQSSSDFKGGKSGFSKGSSGGSGG